MTAPSTAIDPLIGAAAMTAFDWRAHLRVHPAAELFPLMSEAELRELAEDIKANNLVDPVVVWADDNGDLFLIDGRNRLDAMALAGILGVDDCGILFNVKTGEPVYMVSFPDQKPCVIGGDPYAIALSLNVRRRHLNAEQKRDLIADVLKLNPEKSNRQIAEQVKDDHKKVGDVRSKLEATGAIPQLKKTKGKDGKARPVKTKKKPASTAVSPAPIKAAEPEAKPAAPIEAAQPEAKPAVVTIPAKTTEATFIRITDLARDCRGLLAHPEQNADEIRKKLSQIIKLSDPNSKGRTRANGAAKSNAKLDPKLFRRALALEGGNEVPAHCSGNDVDTEQSADEHRKVNEALAASDDHGVHPPDGAAPAAAAPAATPAAPAATPAATPATTTSIGDDLDVRTFADGGLRR